MTDNAHHAGEDYARGTMDISGHVETWLAFWNAAKWSSLGIVILVVLLALFRTHNG